MAATRRPRSRSVQPELPLPTPRPLPPAPGGGAGRLAVGDRAPGDWRIDEHTRMLGRLGIAAARARLAAAAARAEALDPRRAGRAA